MDYSALTEAQQQQYQQYQQQDQQQQQQQHQQQPYDPAHHQQQYDAYYAYQQQQQQQQYDASAYHQQQYDASAYHHQQYYPQEYYQPAAQPDPTPAPAPTHAAAASATYDSSQIHAPHHYPVGASASAAAPGHGYAVAPPVAQEQQGPAYQAPSGLNPAAAAAVAALSQLTQFAGTMDAAERAMAGRPDRQWHAKDRGMTGAMAGGHPSPQPMHQQYPEHPMQHGAVPIRNAVGGRSPYRGGGRRGGGPFRGGGGGRGKFGHHPSRQDGPPTPFHGRGRGRAGRGGGRRSHLSAHDTQPPHTAPSPVVNSQSTQEPAPALVAASALPRLPLVPTAWCDMCRVDCNSFEILEQHKNGKRHKKTMQRLEGIQAQQRLMADLQAKAAPKPEMVIPRVEEDIAPAQVGGPNNSSVASESIPAAFISAQSVEANKVSTASENTPTPISMTESKVEPEMQSQTVEGQSEPPKPETEMGVPATEAPPTEGGHTRRPRMDGYERDDWRHGSKRKMTRFTRGRGGKRLRSFEPVRSRPAERPREQPRYCTLCNVMCDTPAVFQCHLSGKKHISRIKRFQGQGAVYGPISVYVPPNQPTASQGPEPVFYGLKSHEMIQQETLGLNDLQTGSFGLQQGDQAEQAREAEGTEQSKGDVLPASEGQEAVALDPEGQSAVMEFETKELDSEGQNAVTEFEAKELNQESIALASEVAILDDAALTIATDVVSLPEFGPSFDDNIVLPGLDMKAEEPSADNEEHGSDGATALQ